MRVRHTVGRGEIYDRIANRRIIVPPPRPSRTRRAGYPILEEKRRIICLPRYYTYTAPTHTDKWENACDGYIICARMGKIVTTSPVGSIVRATDWSSNMFAEETRARRWCSGNGIVVYLLQAQHSRRYRRDRSRSGRARKRRARNVITATQVYMRTFIYI